MRLRLSLLAVCAFVSAMMIACHTPAIPTNTPTLTTDATPTRVMAIPTPNAETLVQVLDGMQVETHWLAGVGVDWQTGEPNGKRVPSDDTHCSTFVAAVAQKLNVYILRPPDHSTIMLANAQNDWLNRQGAEQGWTLVADGIAAQSLANQGNLVVASYKNPDPQKHGHIAIVRPGIKDAATLAQEGPQITQAGIDNYISASLKKGFKHHPGAFKSNAIRFFAHPVGK